MIEKLLEENNQLKIKLMNAYNLLAVWKANVKFMRNCMNCQIDKDSSKCASCEKLNNWSSSDDK